MTSEEAAVLGERIEGLRTLLESQRLDDREALTKALVAAEKLADKHNDLIRAAQERDALYATKEELVRLEGEIDRLRQNAVPLALYDEKHKSLAEQVTIIDQWKANVTGRVVGVGVIGAVFIAVVAALITHLIGN